MKHIENCTRLKNPESMYIFWIKGHSPQQADHTRRVDTTILIQPWILKTSLNDPKKVMIIAGIKHNDGR